jgi:ribosomal protein S18 acetylase RimI-like enzyme
VADPASSDRTRPAAVVRAARTADDDALYEICLRTGRNGEDASRDHADPRLLGEVYVGPYLAFAPELAFVLVDATDRPLGYVLGVADTEAFERWCADRWWPRLRARYPLSSGAGSGALADETITDERAEGAPSPADAAILRLIHSPTPTPADVLREYPAHLHVDLLPAGQGSGNGRRLLETLFDALRARGVVGVHLGVSSRNPRAVGFYRHLGFTTLSADEHGATLGLRLD